jgi:thiopeptide-type bacteriocin biosynthesis protein
VPGGDPQPQVVSLLAVAVTDEPGVIGPIALTALGMLDIAAAFCGGLEQGTQWLAGRRPPPGSAADRAIARTAAMLARNGEMSSFGTLPGDLAPSWRQRAETVAAYRKTLDPNADTTHILDSLLHIHHNRYRGIDRDSEGACRRIARQAALARHAAKTPQGT